MGSRCAASKVYWWASSTRMSGTMRGRVAPRIGQARLAEAAQAEQACVAAAARLPGRGRVVARVGEGVVHAQREPEANDARLVELEERRVDPEGEALGARAGRDPRERFERAQ